MVSAAEALGAPRAQEVPPARVYHGMASHILPREESPSAAVALVLAFAHDSVWRRTTGVCAQVLQEGGHAVEKLVTHLAGEVATYRRGVAGRMASQTQTGVEAFAAVLTL